MIQVKPHEIKINITDSAQEQLGLILKNDFTVENLVFRLKISGKGCNGFDYQVGFSKEDPEDLVIDYQGIKLYLDPFTAYYCKEGEIDYIVDDSLGQEGFLFTNFNQKHYRGKFFKNEEKTHLTRSFAK